MSARTRKPKRRPVFDRTHVSDAPSRREHGDSFGDVIARPEELAANASTHRASPDRRSEEPPDAVVDEPERLEGDV